MNYNLDFLISSLAFVILVFYHFINRRKLESINYRFFRLFILIGIFDIVLDIITSILISVKMPELFAMTEIMLTLFYFLQVLVPFSMFLYSANLCGLIFQKMNKLVIILSMPALVMSLLVLINFRLGILFTVDRNGNYIPGIMYLGMYVYAGIYMVIVLILILWKFKKLGRKNFRVIIEFLLIMGICVVIQAVRRELLTTGLGLGLGITVLYLTINNPSAYTDPLTEDFNMQSFVSWLKELYLRKKSFHVLIVNICNLEQINMLFGIQYGDSFLRKISRRLHKIVDGQTFFVSPANDL